MHSVPKKEKTPAEILRERLADYEGELLLADGFEAAFLGVIERCGQSPHVIYDRQKCVEILMERDKMTAETAEEYFDFNVVGAWVGPATPGFLWRPE